MRILYSTLALSIASIPAFAHHSFSAEYDANKAVTIKGVVAKLAWVNPHAYIYVDTKDASGKVSRYAFETSSPNARAQTINSDESPISRRSKAHV